MKKIELFLCQPEFLSLESSLENQNFRAYILYMFFSKVVIKLHFSALNEYTDITFFPLSKKTKDDD